MTEELKPAGLRRPRRLRPVARDSREENDQRFRRGLAELTREADSEGRALEDRHGRAAGSAPVEPEPDLADQPEPGVGGNLDVRT